MATPASKPAKAVQTETAPSSAESKASLSRLRALVEADLKRTDILILEQVHSDVALIPELAGYVIAAGGKRLRPALTLLSARLCGYDGERHIALAAAVEFIHTATLLHDDVVDESTLRRGNATANDVWDNKSSVLVGDFLLSRAFQLMVADGSLRVLQILSDASAVIAEGEVLQLMAAHDPSTTEDRYFDIIRAKTATLFAAACEVGAVVSGKEEMAAALADYGQKLGIAFQLVDDALDYVAEPEALGKNLGDDFREGKITYPVLMAYRHGSADERVFWQHALGGEAEVGDAELKQAQQLIEKHDGIKLAFAKAREFAFSAKRAIASFPESQEKLALMEAADFAVARAF